MKTVQKFGPLPILALCLGLGAAGMYLRTLMLAGQQWAYPCLWAVSLVGMAALACICLFMGKRKKMEKNLPASLPASGVMFLGAGGVFVSFLMLLLGTPDLFDTVVYAMGLLGAICLGIQAYLRAGGKGSTPAGVVVTLALAASHLARFRHWSSDPLLGDYCFQLLAGVFAMLATYNLAGFPIEKGHRRITLFYTHIAAMFCIISLPDAGLDNRLYYGGLALWLLAGSCTRKKPTAPRRKLGGGHVEEEQDEEE